jgi:hypothetical protein
MTLSLDSLGRIPATAPRAFYRVETWDTGRRVADFSTLPEAQAFAVSDARKRGCRYDHKVSPIQMAGR